MTGNLSPDNKIILPPLESCDRYDRKIRKQLNENVSRRKVKTFSSNLFIH